MINFDPNIDNIVASSLQIKASGSIIEQIKKDLTLPDGEDINILLQNEENTPKQSKQSY
jgi:hypothetical protein